MNEENDDSPRWWDQAELTKLVLASNKISFIPRDIKNLSTLVSLDVFVFLLSLKFHVSFLIENKTKKIDSRQLY